MCLFVCGMFTSFTVAGVAAARMLAARTLLAVRDSR
jgi:hypothetical protein